MKKDDEKMIGLLVILIFLMLIFYIIPGLLYDLFNSILGNLILIIISIYIYKKNKYYGLIFGILILILYRFSHFKEGFSQKSINDFLDIQNTINPNRIFDIEMLKKQVSQEELDYYNKNGMWYWNDYVIDLYKDALSKNPYGKVQSDDAVNYARSIYNEKAILYILSMQSKEGQFLLNGVLVNNSIDGKNSNEDLSSGYGNFPYNDSGLIEDKRKDIIKCNLDDELTPKLQRIKYKGKKNFFQYQEEKIQDINYNDLEKIIPGFKYIKGSCNPCVAFSNNPQYNCPFELKLQENKGISKIMKYLWGL